MPPADPELLVRAQAIKPADPDVVWCWNMVIEGIKLGWIDRDELKALLEGIHNLSGWGSDELSFEVHLDGLVQASFVRDKVKCKPEPLLAELEKLAGTSAAQAKAASP